MSYKDSAISFPRVHVECDYRLQLRYDDVIQIEVCLTKLGKSSARLEFRTLRNGETAATGVVIVACMGRITQRAIPIPDDLRAKLTSVLKVE